MLNKIKKITDKIEFKIASYFRSFSFNSVYLGNNILLVQTIDKIRLYLFADDLSITPEIVVNGVWESGVTKVFKSYAKDSNVILEIGSNIGYYTTIGSSHQRSNDSVYISVEANPETFKLLKNNIEINGLINKVRVLNKAFCGNSKENIDFYIPKNHTPSSSVSVPLVDDDYRKINVETINVSDLLAGVKVLNLIKIDAEGCEYKIISSLVDYCDIGSVIIFEYFPEMISQSGNSPGNLIKLLEEYNFEIKIIDKNGEISFFNWKEEVKNHIELIAIKRK